LHTKNGTVTIPAMNWLVTFFLNQSVSLAVSLVGLLFFGGLTVSGLLGSQKRAYLPALVVIDLAIVSSLVRVLLAPVTRSGRPRRLVAINHSSCPDLGIRAVRASRAEGTSKRETRPI
jgi:hypothetical protein